MSDVTLAKDSPYPELLAGSSRRAAPAVLGLFLLLGIVYSVVDPVFEASDELHHYPYVAHLAAGGGLPVQVPGRQTLWKQEGSQPPLYYLLAATLTSWIDTRDLPDVLHFNPHARFGIPLARDNKNMVVHTSAEAFPWTGTALAVHLIRLFSLALAAGSLACTFALVLELFPGRIGLALAAMSVQAFLPMYLFISASVNNDNLVTFMASLVLLLLVRLLSHGASRLRLVGLGVLIGLACLSKLSGLGLLPLALLALALRQPLAAHAAAGCRASYRTMVAAWCAEALAVVLPVILVAGWWYVRNWRLYGDPTGLNVMVAIAGSRPSAPSLGQLLSEFEGFRISFWGLFGGVNVLLQPTWIYRVLDGVSLAALLGLVPWAWRQRRAGDPLPSAGLFLAAAWLDVEAVALFRWTSTTLASQGRLLFPVLPAICLYLALGLAGWLPRGKQTWGAWSLAALLFVLAAAAPFTAIRPAYAKPPVMARDQVPLTAQAFNADYGGSIRLLAYQVGADRVRPGETVPITLYWEALAPMTEDYSLYLQLLGQKDAHLAQIDSYAGGTYPTSQWQPGQVIEDTYYLPVTAAPDGPVAARLIAGLYRLPLQDRLPVTDPQGRPVGQPVLTRIKVAGPSSAMAPEHRLVANFQDRVRLIGYDLPDAGARVGASVSLTLHWQVTGELDGDYTVFLHVVDAAGQVVGQGDALPLGGDYPTHFWAPGEHLADPHVIALEPGAAPGSYRIMVGLYRADTGQRLPVIEAGSQDGDESLIATFDIRP